MAAAARRGGAGDTHCKAATQSDTFWSVGGDSVADGEFYKNKPKLATESASHKSQNRLTNASHAMAAERSNSEELILRDHLALDRTRLANERTLLAYLRTALMLLVAGATAVKFVADSPGVVVTGWLFVGLGAGVGILGAWRYAGMRRTINRRAGDAIANE